MCEYKTKQDQSQKKESNTQSILNPEIDYSQINASLNWKKADNKVLQYNYTLI